MSWNFDRIINRRNTQCISTDACRGHMDIPYPDEELVRMWIADMDFAAPEEERGVRLFLALEARADDIGARRIDEAAEFRERIFGRRCTRARF